MRPFALPLHSLSPLIGVLKHGALLFPALPQQPGSSVAASARSSVGFATPFLTGNVDGTASTSHKVCCLGSRANVRTDS